MFDEPVVVLTKKGLLPFFIINHKGLLLEAIHEMVCDEGQDVMVWLYFCKIERLEFLKADKTFEAVAFQRNLPR